MSTRIPVATLLTAVALVLAAPSFVAQPSASVSHLYNLADFSGPLPLNSSRLYSDPVWDEIYVLYQGHVRIFNDSGMQVFSFGDDPALGYVRDVVADSTGRIFLLSYDYSDPAIRTRYYISRCNYRGEFGERIEVSGLPETFAAIQPDQLLYAGGRLYLLSAKQMLLVSIGTDGQFSDGIDLEPYVVEQDDRPDGLQVNGLTVTDSGQIVFSVAVKFRVYRLDPDGSVSAFGEGGSAAGQFGVIGGVATDRTGHIFVTDKLRNVVSVFDRDFRHVTEFGFRDASAAALVRPQDIVSDDSGRLYVTQVGNRGVAVFQVYYRQQNEVAVEQNRVSARIRKEVPFSELEASQLEITSLNHGSFDRISERLLRHGETRRESGADANGSLTIATAGLPE